MTVRFYSSVAAETTLVGAIDNSVTSMQIASAVGLPSVPFTMAVDYESSSEELVEVTAVAGTTLTITRAIDGTSATSHNSAARVRHVSSARDFSDSRSHENASTDVHGLAGGAAVVGDTSTQTLTNKTISGGTFSGSIAGTPTYTGEATFSGGMSVSGNIAGSPTFTGTPTFSAGAALSGTFSGNHTVSGTSNHTGLIQSTRTNATDVVLAAIFGASAFDSFRALANGRLEWGSGSAARDTFLYRSGVNALTTDGDLTISGATTTTPTTVTAGLTFATDWGAGSLIYRTTANVHFLDVEVVRTGANFTPASTTGNISPDLTICTLPVGTRPSSALYILASTGIGHGSLRINPDGTCELLSWIPDPVIISNGSTVRFTTSWIE